MRVYYATGYDSAQICSNGHVVNHSSQRQFEHNLQRCPKCGAETITRCLCCDDPIRGMYYGGAVAYYERPAYCSSCGKAYPWTEAALKAAKEFAEEQFAEADRNQLADIIENLVHETPRTPLAVTRMKKLLEEAQPEVSEGLRQVMIELLKEGVKRAIWGP